MTDRIPSINFGFSHHRYAVLVKMNDNVPLRFASLGVVHQIDEGEEGLFVAGAAYNKKKLLKAISEAGLELVLLPTRDIRDVLNIPETSLFSSAERRRIMGTIQETRVNVRLVRA